MAPYITQTDLQLTAILLPQPPVLGYILVPPHPTKVMPKTKIVNEQMKIIGYRISSETDHLSSVHRALDFNLSTGKLAKIKTWINFHANYRNKNSMSLDFFLPQGNKEN